MTERPYSPWLPVTVRDDNDLPRNNLEIRKADCVALQAVSQGEATKDQQKRAWAAILYISGVNQMVWMPEARGGDRDTTFAAGKQHVGHQLLKLASISLSILTGGTNDRAKHDRSTGRPEDERNAERAKPRDR